MESQHLQLTLYGYRVLSDFYQTTATWQMWLRCQIQSLCSGTHLSRDQEAWLGAAEQNVGTAAHASLR